MAKKKAAAHHGGAWKVAYADFVTAMMALFMVLWISAQDQEVLIATSQYFQSPFSSAVAAKSGVMNFDSVSPSAQKSSDGDAGQAEPSASSPKSVDLQFLNTVAADFMRMLNLDESMADKPIDVQVTSDGLRITLFDRVQRPLFEDTSAKFTEWGSFVMQSVAWLIDRNDFAVVIEGHTRAGLNLPKADYSAWELSSDRANAARRLLVHYAVDGQLIERVTGYADTRPVPLLTPEDPSNQRVTLSLRLGRRSAQPEPTVLPPAPPSSHAPSPSSK